MIEFNLVPKNLRNRSRTAINWLRVGAIAAVALTLLAISVSVINGMSLAMYQRELQEQTVSVRSVDIVERQLRDLRSENQRIANEIDRLEALGDRGETEQFLRFLAELSAITSDGILIQVFEYSRGGSVLVAGMGADAAEVSRYFDRVRQLDGVRDAALSQLRRPAGDDSPLRSFELRFQWQVGS